MKASLEISMYPLDQHYGNLILDFIHRLKQYATIEVSTNRMSTQVFGEYDEVMTAVTKEMKTSFEEDETIVMVMKVINLEA